MSLGRKRVTENAAIISNDYLTNVREKYEDIISMKEL